MTGDNGTAPPIPLPHVFLYEDRYADAIYPLATLMSDGTDYDKEHWTYDVAADELTLTDLPIMERRLKTLKSELQALRTANENLTAVGAKWMEVAEKHPEKVAKDEQAKYRKLRDQHDVLVLQGNAATRIKELLNATVKMQTSYDKGQKRLESKNSTGRFGNRNGFPGPTGAFRGSGSASNNRQGAPIFNTSSSFANNSNTAAGGNADATSDANAYASSFFKDGNLADLMSTTPASDKPLKLASQPIEKFDGDVTKFPVFRHQFLRAAHRSKDTDDIDRFFYLLSLLDGPAKQLVNGIAPLSGCYERACETLQLRYGDPDEIYRQLLRELKQLKPLQTGCSADQIEKFTNKFAQCLASIDELGRADTSGRTLEELEEKLPPDVREKIQEQRRSDPSWNETDLHRFLLERAAILRAIHGDKGRPPGHDSSKFKIAVTAAAKPPDDRRRSGAPPGRKRMQTPAMECVFCPSNDHWGSKCHKYRTLGQRYQRIMELDRCYICLNKHKADSCRSSTARECRLCNEKHHISFCPVRYESERKASKTHSSTVNEDDKDYNEPDFSADASDQASSDADEFDDTSHKDESHGTHAILSNKDNGTRQTTLLECVEVTVGHPTIKSRQCKTVLVFDSCSTQTFIKKSLFGKLGLPQLSPTKLSIGTFMATEDVNVDTFYTQLRVRKNNGKCIKINAPVVDRLCGQVQSVLMSKEEEAEVREGSCALRPSTETPEILVGRDLRSLFKVVEEHETLPSGFVLAHSNVGSMIVGRGLTQPASASSEVSDKVFFIRGSAIEPRREVTLDQLMSSADASNVHTDTVRDARDANAVDDAHASAITMSALPMSAIPTSAMPTSATTMSALPTSAIPKSPMTSVTTPTSAIGEDTTVDAFCKDLLGQLQEAVRHKVSHASDQSQPVTDQKLEYLLHQMHSLEQLGVELPDHLNEEDAIHQRIRDSIRWVDGRYEVGLPWRTADGKAPSNKELPDNFSYAFACLQALIKTLSKFPELLVEYDRVFKEYLASGIITEVKKECQYTVHYLSHHAVLKKGSATTKTRPVYNGNAKPDKSSPSLNDMLHKGPLLLNPITAVLLNSRLAPYVLSADVAKAFLQVSLREEDRHVCRFLWVRDLTKPASGDNLVIYCFNRVIFGLRPSPALLGVTIEHHMQTLDTKLSREILANCYVDNIYLTADDLAEASAKYQDSKEIFASMNMNLREFATNDTSFNASLPKDDQARFEGFKQLGIHWDLDADEWVFDFKVGSLNENWSPKVRRGRKKSNTTTCLEPTKRLMSSTTLSQFDPLGLVNPAILLARLAVQAACKEKYGWDDPVNTDIVDQWNKAVDCWASTEIRVPRLIKPKGDEVVELHVFCDASGYSYGACAYLTVQTTEGARSSTWSSLEAD